MSDEIDIYNNPLHAEIYRMGHDAAMKNLRAAFGRETKRLVDALIQIRDNLNSDPAWVAKYALEKHLQEKGKL